MNGVLDLAAANLVSPLILSFVLGAFAAFVRSDLTFPEAAAKAMSIYLLFAIGFKGGVSVSSHGVDGALGVSLVTGVLLSGILPFVAFALLKLLTRLDRLNAAAVAGHYGSISIVTFVAGTSILESQGIGSEGYMVAVAAAMEAPAILSALWLISAGGQGRMDGHLWREILLNGSIVLLVGSFLIGMITGEEGLEEISSFIVSPFKGVLCSVPARHGACGGALHPGQPGVANGRCVCLRDDHALYWCGIWSGCGPYDWSVSGWCIPVDGAVSLGVLYRSTCGHACGRARGGSGNLSHTVAGRDLSA